MSLGTDYPFGGIVLKDVSGDRLSLDKVKKENGLLVIFSCNTCPWVIRWEDRYVKIAEKYSSKGIGIIAVNSNEDRFNGDDSMKKMKKHAKKNKYNFPYVQDQGSKLARAFGASRTPHIFLFNKQNKLVYKGAIDDNARDSKNVEEPYLSNAIDEMLAGEDIAVSSTKALGCSIKFK
tara:strand:- start:500 stop:1030 length:531 start_codon:yes stop_codon:yes gene_type:complete